MLGQSVTVGSSITSFAAGGYGNPFLAVRVRCFSTTCIPSRLESSLSFPAEPAIRPYILAFPRGDGGFACPDFHVGSGKIRLRQRCRYWQSVVTALTVQCFASCWMPAANPCLRPCCAGPRNGEQPIARDLTLGESSLSGSLRRQGNISGFWHKCTCLSIPIPAASIPLY